MNIFVLDYNPVSAARMQCDKHVVKMPLETAQILCCAHPVGTAPYKRTHYNHPCSKWSRLAKENYQWLIEHGLALCDEYNFRYGKVHQSKRVISWCQEHIFRLDFVQIKKSRFVLCFDEKYIIGNAVCSYRNYYKKEKTKIAQWNKGRSKPSWY